MKNKVAIVAANYYENITNDLVDGVKNNLNESFDTSTYFVDGAWEIIYKINDLLENESIDKGKILVKIPRKSAKSGDIEKLTQF